MEETSEEFKKLEMETELRRDHTEKIFGACNEHLKAMSRRKDLMAKDARLPTEQLAATMIGFGSVLHEDSDYGRSLISVGEAHERIAALQVEHASMIQNSYVNQLQGVLNDLRDYARLKAKLENRRLDFDAKLNKLHKSKKEDSVLEEGCRVAQSKYEETLSDTTDKMIELNTNEDEQLVALLEFVDSEVEYFQGSLDIVTRLQADLAGYYF
ncbi:hypothetical protein HK101_011149 [Irineochytrium annulatum]|nr:hypothetical protein HK101_011149 [Irineochytrium annulatum]